MEVRAVSKYVRISPRKVHKVIGAVKGKSAESGIQILKFMPQKAASILEKIVRSAVANAQFKAQEDGDVLDVDTLHVREAFVDEGATLRRWRARAMGRASPIRKRTSHITVIVDTKE